MGWSGRTIFFQKNASWNSAGKGLRFRGRGGKKEKQGLSPLEYGEKSRKVSPIRYKRSQCRQGTNSRIPKKRSKKGVPRNPYRRGLVDVRTTTLVGFDTGKVDLVGLRKHGQKALTAKSRITGHNLLFLNPSIIEFW